MILRTAYDLEWIHRVPTIVMLKVCEKDFGFLARTEDFRVLISTQSRTASSAELA
jgi:hypothetical protein